MNATPAACGRARQTGARSAVRGGLDFDDLVGRALQLLENDAALLGRWRQRCAHLLLDEVQDVDRSQLDLAILLAGPERRIFLVGEDDQTRSHPAQVARPGQGTA